MIVDIKKLCTSIKNDCWVPDETKPYWKVQCKIDTSYYYKWREILDGTEVLCLKDGKLIDIYFASEEEAFIFLLRYNDKSL